MCSANIYSGDWVAILVFFIITVTFHSLFPFCTEQDAKEIQALAHVLPDFSNPALGMGVLRWKLSPWATWTWSSARCHRMHCRPTTPTSRWAYSPGGKGCGKPPPCSLKLNISRREGEAWFSVCSEDHINNVRQTCHWPVLWQTLDLLAVTPRDNYLTNECLIPTLCQHGKLKLGFHTVLCFLFVCCLRITLLAWFQPTVSHTEMCRKTGQRHFQIHFHFWLFWLLMYSIA